ncbi:MAG: FtsX-like permease family protein, partial [Chloroflexota bacterium]|nr:FtsX-like permease family protein [Chloroflexota bacterium]
MTAGGLRVSVRLGVRAARRGRWRSVLVALLIALPVMAMSGATAVLETITPTPERLATARMGTADLIALSFEAGDGGTGDELLISLLPAGARAEPVADTSDTALASGSEFGVSVRALDLDGLAAGMLDLVSGRTPQGPGEVAISASTARLGGIGAGDELALRSLGAAVVVGIVEDPMNLRTPIVLVDPPTEGVDGVNQSTYLVGLPDGVTFDMLDPVLLGHLPEEPPFLVTSRAQAATRTPTQADTVFVLGGLALIEAALIASAAFAVSIRRRQRDLGLMSAAGGEPGHLRATVLAEGAVLGIAGAAAGLLLGVIAAAATAPWLEQLTDRRTPPLVLLPHWLVMAASIGLLAALVAAVIPAWSASRVPVLAALSGRRPVSTPARRTLRIGLAMVVVGTVVTLAGSLYRLEEGSGSLWTILLLVGAVLGVLGFGACSPWLLERLEGPASRMPLAARLALRDTARFRSRNGPIVTAVLAGFAATVAVSALLASQDARADGYYQPMLRTDQVLVVGPGAAEAGPGMAERLGAIASGPLVSATAPGTGGLFPHLDLGTGEDMDGLGSIAVADEAMLTALGGEPAMEAFRRGEVILLRNDEPRDRELSLLHDDGTRVEAIPYRIIPTEVPYGAMPSAVVSTGAAARLGLGAEVDGRFLIRLPHQVTNEEAALAASLADTRPDTAVNVEQGSQRPGDAFRLLLLLASLVFALSITAVAVALGEAETRSDQRTLLALGADPSVRRRITAARAGVLAAIAGVLAVPAGLLPVWGLLFT